MHSGHAGDSGHDCDQIGGGVTIDDLLADYPYPEREDIYQALRYAAWRVEDREIELAPV